MIPYGRHHIDEEDIQAVVSILKSGVLSQGPAIEAFEKAIALSVGVKFAVAVSSATAGLHIAATAAGVTQNTTLITSPITFVASSNAGLYNGASVAFADTEAETVNMNPESLKKVLDENPNTRAIVPVHFGGLPCNMPAIKALADQTKAVIIEDAAHALGATYPSGEKVGSCRYSLMTVFSFHPVKAIAAGEGGMITTNDEKIYRELIRLRSHGINKLDDSFQVPEQAFTDGVQNSWYYEMQELGYHYRITDIQAGLALSQFKKLDKFIARRIELVKRYDNAFANMKNLRPAQPTENRNISGHHLYVLRIDYDAIKLSRNELMKELRKRDIGSQVHYIPVPAQPFYRKLGFKPEDYPNANDFYKEALSIPLFYDLTDDQQDLVIATLKELIS
jgi:UDP-4-amino-4,6-dideoxy-N-acetyl-beta-L-altrosamine transaminase